MQRSSLRKLLLLLSLAMVFAFAPRARAQEEGDGEENPELKPLLELLQKADKLGEDKKYDEAIKSYEELFAKVEKAKIPAEAKKEIEASGRYNYGCSLSLTGKKAEAIKAVARSIELGYTDFDHMDEDKDLDPIRNEPEFKSMLGEARKKPLFAFDFDVKTIDGKTLKLSDLKGKVVIVDFWGTWCPPCREEIPSFVKLYEAYKDKGLEIVGLACEKNQAEAQKLVSEFAKDKGIKYPLAPIDPKTDASIKAVPNFQGFPTTLFIDRDGKVRALKVGLHPYEALEKATKSLLDEKSDSKAAEPKKDEPKKAEPKKEDPNKAY